MGIRNGWKTIAALNCTVSDRLRSLNSASVNNGSHCDYAFQSQGEGPYPNIPPFSETRIFTEQAMITWIENLMRSKSQLCTNFSFLKSQATTSQTWWDFYTTSKLLFSLFLEWFMFVRATLGYVKWYKGKKNYNNSKPHTQTWQTFSFISLKSTPMLQTWSNGIIWLDA